MAAQNTQAHGWANFNVSILEPRPRHLGQLGVHVTFQAIQAIFLGSPIWRQSNMRVILYLPPYLELDRSMYKGDSMRKTERVGMKGRLHADSLENRSGKREAHLFLLWS